MNNNYQYFDATILDTLYSIMGDNIADLYREYAKDVKLRLVNIEAQITDLQDPYKIQMLAHSLKGSSANVGANHMAKLCGHLEDAARDGSVDFIEQIFQDIKTHYYCMSAELDQLIS